MANNLSGLSAEYVYFCAYMAHEDLNELCKVNGTMLSSFIEGLEKTCRSRRSALHPHLRLQPVRRAFREHEATHV
jgi:hypothetical protein